VCALEKVDLILAGETATRASVDSRRVDVGTIPASSSAKGLLVIDKLNPLYLETGGERSEMQAEKGVVDY
jgi:hypothetical protein